jgi:hypothetical protein
MWQRERRASHPQFYELFEKEKNLIYKRNLDHNPRLKLLLAIGIQCVCTRPNCWHGNQRCIVNDLRCINLDHKLGNGIQDRKRFKRPENMYAYYYKDLDLARRIFQPLCANCNTIKGGTAADYSSISACPISF